MPRLISIRDAKKRDAQIEVGSPKRRERMRWVGPDREPVRHQRLVKGTEKTTYEALLERFGTPEAVGAALVEGDPEIDLGQVGRRLAHTSRVYLDPDGHVLYVARVLKVTYDPHGEEIAREDFVDVEATVGEELPPIPWSGKLMPIDTVIRRFAFVRKLQLRHVNGLTFDFLYEIAQTLQEAGKVMLVRAGAKGRDPLIFQTNGTPFHGFLEGRVEGDAYKLVLHLSNLEIKRVTEDAPEATS
ncbi:MAG TPA: hypothetical protein RMH99_04920 [Sandaracinaceae bacterium LLY-WYZ-13_1]|nr:hypothetical protein [Sandaracinaceae bacterium LLY-WYZ-13_1]